MPNCLASVCTVAFATTKRGPAPDACSAVPALVIGALGNMISAYFWLPKNAL
jgi:hypothetical protein